MMTMMTMMTIHRRPLLFLSLLITTYARSAPVSRLTASAAADKAVVPPPPPPPSSWASLSPTTRRNNRRSLKKGRVSIDLKGNTMLLFPYSESDDDMFEIQSGDEPLSLEDSSPTTTGTTATTTRSHRIKSMLKGHQSHNKGPSSTESTGNEISLTLSPLAALRLAKISWLASVSFFTAFSHTLRLLAPLILARRALNAFGDFLYDYMRGRYIRKTYTKWETLYVHYYELPAVMRALARMAAQLTILFFLSFVTSHIIASIPGMKHPFQPLETESCWWSGSLWAVLCVGGGHLGAKALTEWGGKSLRIQVKADIQSARRLSRVFTRPWHIFQWMKDPEEWITTTLTSARRVPLSNTLQEQPQPFTADPILFPATWAPLRLLQMIGVAGALSKPRVMTQFLIQESLADEWYRMLVSERRVTLGLCVAVCYLISTLSLILTISALDVSSSIFLIPHLLAVVVSTWMNLIIFWNRLEEKYREAAVQAFRERRNAVLKAIGYC